MKTMQYVTMNRFKIKPEHAKEYGELWKNHESLKHMHRLPGFISFNFFQLDSEVKTDASGQKYVLFASYAAWESKEHFTNWVQSEHFAKAHANNDKHMYIERPELECFEVLI